MKHELSILKSDQEPSIRVTHLVIVCLGQILGGFIVAIFISMLVTSFFPDLSTTWRAILLIGATALFGFALIWAQLLDLDRREKARQEGIKLIDVPRRF